MVCKKKDIIILKNIIMSKVVKILIVSFVMITLMGQKVMAQNNLGNDPEKCRLNLSIFYEYAKAKNYKAAFEPWMWCMDNCPKGSKNIYKYGLKMAMDRYKKATPADKAKAKELIVRVYEQRIVQYPDHLGKVYSNYAKFMQSSGSSKDVVFNLLEKAFKADPSGMGVRSIYQYFQEVTNRNKDTNVQLIFDTYDDVVEAVELKIANYTKTKEKLYALKSAGQKLSAKNKRKLHAAEVNSNALETVTGGLDNILGEVATCDRLIPLYNQNFEANKNNAKWLKRAASRMNAKECTDDPLFTKLVEALYAADPSPAAAVLAARVAFKKKDEAKAMHFFKEAVDQETDSYKKAGHLFTIAQLLQKKHRKQEARSYARQALKFRPNMGEAYFLIASLYASSANSCGTDELSKRAVFLAAVDKAKKAKAVDPSKAKRANKYIKSYMASAPTKKNIFIAGLASGSKYHVKCWINETVILP
jgi:tetratricopeptide (TPR) repeat protein